MAKSNRVLFFVLAVSLLVFLVLKNFEFEFAISDGVGDGVVDVGGETVFAPKSSANLEFVECQYPAHYSFSHKLKCAVFHSAAEDGKFSLPLTVIASTRKTKDAPAVVFVPGGPGQGDMTAPYNVEYWYHFLEAAKFPFDFILYEPRGTHAASPSWDCEEYHLLSRDLLEKDSSVYNDRVLAFPVIEDCMERYDNFLREEVPQSVALKEGEENTLKTQAQEKKQGLSLLSSYYQANDLNNMMEALGYNNWHIWGESYGTRVALLAANERVGRLILDSPYPLNKDILSDWESDIERRFQIHQQQYEEVYKEKTFPDFMILWDQALRLLKASPKTLSIKTDTLSLELLVNRNRLSALALYVLYSENLRIPFYEALEYMAKGFSEEKGQYGRDSLNRLFTLFLQSTFAKNFNYMTYYAVECLDNKNADEIEFSHVPAGDSERFRYLYEGADEYNVCDFPYFQDVKKVIDHKQTKRPSLILVGETDPVTPAEWARELKREIASLATLYIADGVGHGVSAEDVCRSALYVDFLRAKKIDIEEYCE